MNAWLLPRLGSIDNLQIADVPDPVAGPGEVVLEVLFAALNPADRYLAEGAYPARPSLPHVLGRDGVGRVIALGEGVNDVRLGDIRAVVRGETGVTRFGTFAGRVTVAVDSLADVPAGWSLEEEAGATLVYLTAHQAIRQWDDLPENPVTLITGASGGVGVAATQLAKSMGHTVVGLSRSAEKATRLRAIGADFTFDPAVPTWPKQFAAQVGRKVSLVIDNIGGPGFNDLLGVMDMNGRLSVVGALAGPVPSFNTPSLFFRRLRIGGVAAGTYSREEAHAAWGELVALLEAAKQRPIVDRIFEFADLPAAFARLKDGPMGKVLLRVHSVA